MRIPREARYGSLFQLTAAGLSEAMTCTHSARRWVSLLAWLPGVGREGLGFY